MTRKRRVALASVAVVAAAAGVGGWWLGRDNSGSGAASGAAFAALDALVGEPSTDPPALSPADVIGVLEDSAVLSDPAVMLTEVSVEQEDGTTYHFDGSSWSAITPGGGVWVVPQDEVVVVDRDGVIDVQAAIGADTGWAEEVLAAMPGVSRDEEIFVVDDYVVYRDGFIQAAAAQGVWVDEPIRGSVVMTRPVTFEPVWVEPGDGHTWIADRTAAVLIVEDGDESVVAGRLIPDETTSGSVWEPVPGAGSVSGHVEQVFAGIDGATVENGRRRVPFKIYVQPDEDVLAKTDQKRVAYENFNGSVEVTVVFRGDDGGGCSMFGCFADAVASTTLKVGTGTYRIGSRYGGEALDKVDLTNCAQTGVFTGGLTCDDTVVSLAEKTQAIAEILFVERGNVFAELNCGSPGPNPPGDPEGKAPRAYPPADYEERIAAWSDPTGTVLDVPDRLAFARAWMPLLEFSLDEQCGEVLRVFANLNAYAPDGGRAASLDEAARIEITYTLFFRYDGGRFRLLGADHPGDNEGFVIGLVRTERRGGLCDTGFEFAGGRTVGHSNVGLGVPGVDYIVVDYLEFNHRQIDDFTPEDVGTTCPDPNPRDRGDPWRILVAEGKHATYYHRDPSQRPPEGIPVPNEEEDPNGTNCEAALVPDLPKMLAAMAFGNAEVALLIPAIEKLAGEDVFADLQEDNGLEECEAGRDLVSLADRLELYGPEVAAGNPTDLGFATAIDVYETESGLKTFMEQARGRVCYARWPEDEEPACDGYDFHVPRLFEVPAAALPPPTVEIPDMRDWTEAAARAEFDRLELVFRPVTTVVTDPAKDGLVIRHVPAGGTSVTVGSPVEVVLGVYEMQEIPRLEGKDARDARSDLSIYGFEYVPVFEPVDNPDLDNVVLWSDPPEGTPAAAGTVVRVGVGMYQEPEAVLVAAPDVKGKTFSTARAEIEGLGLVYSHGGTTPTGDPGLDGLVAAQTPDPGTALLEGDTVTVYEGEYTPPQVPIPDLGGLPEADAIAAIEAVGLVADVAGTIETTDSGFVGRVMDQNPLDGTVVAGSTVRIWIGVASGSETGTPPSGGALDPAATPERRLTLSSGFNPDPNLTQNVAYAGSLAVDVSYLGGGCTGYAMTNPSFQVSWSGGGDLLRFFFIPPDGADTTMVVRAPNGQWYCNDDSFSTIHPSVTFTGPSNGAYLVWIGAFSGGGTGGAGDLYVTEVPEYTP